MCSCPSVSQSRHQQKVQADSKFLAQEVPLPSLGFDVNFILKSGQDKCTCFFKDGTLLTLTKSIKSDLLKDITEAAFSYKADPSDDEITQIAAELVST